MKKFYCNGKKDFCEDHDRCSENCRYLDFSGGEYREVTMTNGDRIRAMSDEELAEFLIDLADDGNLRIRDWLQQPAEDIANG